MMKILRVAALWAIPFALLTGWADTGSLESTIAAKHTILLSDQWGGGHRIKFDFNGHTAWLVEPANPAPGRNWFWTMMWVDAFVAETERDKMVERGLYHVHLDVHDDRANAEGLRKLAEFHDYLVNELGFARKTRLVGMSWGGFYSIRYANAHPERVDRIYLDAPLMNVYTRPAEDLGPWAATAAGGGANDPEQPINMASAMAASKIPLFLVYGGADVAVVPRDNCEIFIERYQKAGGSFVAIDLDPARGHHPHGPSADYAERLLDFMTSDFTEARIAFANEIVPGTNFSEAEVKVTAQVLNYGCSEERAQVEVTLRPVGGGEVQSKTFEIDGDLEPHDFIAKFDGLAPGGRYRVEARVVVGPSDFPASPRTFAEAREVAWFAESAATFPNAGWTYDAESVSVEDGLIAASPTEGHRVAFAPSGEDASGRIRLVTRVKFAGGTDFEGLEPVVGKAGVSGTLASDGNGIELAVWGEGAWHLTGQRVADGEEKAVAIDIDRPDGVVGYRLLGPDDQWADLGSYALADADTPVERVTYDGLIAIRNLEGRRYDANLVADEKGREYADHAAAKASGAEDPLHPLWRSVWNLAGVYGSLTYRDPDGLVAFAGASRVLASDSVGDGGVTRCWYGPATDAEIDADAAKYVRQTVALGLKKAITATSDIRLADCAMADGELSFRIGIDGAPVTQAAVTSLVEVCGDLRSGSWKAPSSVRFADGKVVVTPERGAVRDFARVRIEAE